MECSGEYCCLGVRERWHKLESCCILTCMYNYTMVAETCYGDRGACLQYWHIFKVWVTCGWSLEPQTDSSFSTSDRA